MKHLKYLSLIIISILLIIHLILNHIYKPITYTESKILFGTVVKITLNGPRAKETVDTIFKELSRLNNTFNIYNPHSLVYKLNKDKTLTTTESSLFEILSISKIFSEITDGAFDITIQPLVKLYKKYKDKNEIPPDSEIKEATKKVNYKYINSYKDGDHFKITLNPQSSIDLGGVAKGYAIEKAMQCIKNKKVNYLIIDAGGNIKIQGAKEQNLGIQHPRKTNEIISKIKLSSGQTVSTSGDYQRYFIYKGKRYHHIIDPKTGYPSNKCQSVTVIGHNSTYTDILSTAIFILGPDKIEEIINKTNGTFKKDNYRIYVINNSGKLLKFIF